MQDQRDTTEIEKRFITAHTRTGAPCKNKACDLAMRLHGCPAILRLCAGLAQHSGGL
jgi:hypothetical protein